MTQGFQDFSHASSGVLAVVILLTAGTLVVSRDWRVSLIVLAAQYVALWVLVGGVMPVRVALGKLVAGWAVCGILALSAAGTPAATGEETRLHIPTGWPFRVLAAGMVAIVVLTLADRPDFAIPDLSPPATFAGYALIGLGLLNLGFAEAPFRSAVGLLMALSGFELLYAAVEKSVAVVALLAAVNVGVALSASVLALRTITGEEGTGSEQEVAPE